MAAIFFVSILVSVNLTYTIAEKYFFDKFFYQKSRQHGYLAPSYLNIKAYGRRYQDVVSLMSEPDFLIDESRPLAPGINLDHRYFNIALIGDSHVWGQGVKDQDRFPVLLEKKLSKDRKTKVRSFAQPGDSIHDHLAKYLLIKPHDFDLYIFSITDNDLIFNNDHRYKSVVYDRLTQTCHLDKQNTIFGDYEDDTPEFYSRTLAASYQAAGNLCAFKEVVKSLPGTDTIYFFTDDYSNDADSFTAHYQFIQSQLSTTGGRIITAKQAQDFEQYARYWDDNHWQHFTVSPADGHPSKLAHQMYADILYDHIIRTGFAHQ